MNESMTNDINVPEFEEPILEKEPIKYYSLPAILTFICIPPLWCLSIPAMIFSLETKQLDELGESELAKRFSQKAKKFIISSWLIAAILAISFAAVYIIAKSPLI